MSDIRITPDCKLIRVLADHAKNQCNDGDAIREAKEIMSELASDMSPANRHMIAQTVAYTVNNLQKQEFDFLNQIADVKTIGYGDKAEFNVKSDRGIKAVIQAKGGSTTPRSFETVTKVPVMTHEVSARPAINIYDLRTGRIDMGDMIAEANRQMTIVKLSHIEDVLHKAIATYSSPFYATGTGVNKAALDAQINYFRRLGQVNVLGDIAAVSQMSNLVGMSMNSNTTQRSNGAMDEFNENGYIGRYNGALVTALTNAYGRDGVTPALKPNWLYILPVGLSADARDLKVVNEGEVNAFEAQDINDMVFEIRLDQAFGAAFVKRSIPNIGAYCIN